MSKYNVIYFKKKWKFIKSFGLYYALVFNVYGFVKKRYPQKGITKFFHKYNYRLAYKIIYRKYKRIIQKHINADEYSSKYKIDDSKYIWVCWWQGEEKAPSVVKACIKSIRKEFKNKHLIVIDEQNYKDYISIPKSIIDKVNRGIFTTTFFSDILRTSLLSKYGGIWIDATVFIANLSIPINTYSFFSVKHNLFRNWHVCRGKWSGFFMGCAPGNNGVALINDILEQYALDEEQLMAYLLIDVAISIAYDYIPSFHMQVDQVPINNTKIFEMDKDMNKSFDKYIIPSDINKLSYKHNYRLEKNKMTVYKALLEGLL